MPKQQPTILVKKADGTKVRVFLDEFKKLRNKEPLPAGRQEGTRNEEVSTMPAMKTKIDDAPNVSGHDRVAPLDNVEKKEEKIESVIVAHDASSAKDMSDVSKRIILKPAIMSEEERGKREEKNEFTLKKDIVTSPPPPPPPPPQSNTSVGDRSQLDKLINAEEARTQFSAAVSKFSTDNVTKDKSESVDVNEEKHDDIQVATPHELATTTPVTDIFVDEAQAADEWDHASLLEEDMSEIEELKQHGAVHTTHEDVTQKVSVPNTVKKTDDNVSTRLKSLIASWQKGIRSDIQFIEMATRDVEHSGVGMDETSAQGLLDELKKSKVAGGGFATNEASPKKRVTMDDISAQNRLPHTPSSPVVKTAPVNAPRPAERSGHSVPPQIMRDVEKADVGIHSVGPQQEAGMFTLVDFRRLSSDPHKAGDMLLSKFMNWKAESFLLYMNARTSWHESPLYQQYVSLTREAMDMGKNVAEVLNEKDPKTSMTFEEYSSIIAVDGQLTV